MILLVGSIWFWVFIIAFALLELYLVEQEHGWWSLGAGVAFLVAIQWQSDLGIFAWIAAHPTSFLVGLLVYFVVGSIWGVTKWFFYVKDSVLKYKEVRRDFLSHHTRMKKATLDTLVPEEYKLEWDNYCFKTPPKASDNKSKIVMWMGYWPWSLFWTMLRDPFKWMYNRLAGRLEKISEAAYKAAGFDEDSDLEAAKAAKAKIDKEIAEEAARLRRKNEKEILNESRGIHE
jgi:hypothetical protein